MHYSAYSLPVVVFVFALLPCGGLLADEDPVVVRIGSSDVTEGDIQLLLRQRRLVREGEQPSTVMRQAAAASLVRQRLAMLSIIEEGGAAIQLQVDEAQRRLRAQIKATGVTMKDYAVANGTTAGALERDVAWRTVWNAYLKSRLSEASLRRYFDSRTAIYDGTTADVSQVFLSIKGLSTEEISERQATLESIAQKLAGGELTFADAARKHSEAGSAEAGGRLGPVGAGGDLPRVVASAALLGEVGAVQPVVRSSLGLHLLLVHSRQPGSVTFDQLADRKRLRRDAADFLFDHAIGKAKPKHAVEWVSKADSRD